MHTVLTGITTTGTPHIGNYVGAIRPAVAASRNAAVRSYFFLADYHALVKNEDPDRVACSTLEIAAAWLAAGLDPDAVVFYRQSDIPELAELAWILSCVTAKGLMNRAHAYKAAVDENLAGGDKDPDQGITMGLFSYPVLMTADILMFRADRVPVGSDQKQHIEMARDIAARFNHRFGELFVLPEAVIDQNVAVLPGLDGRKMSKSYGNTIPLFTPEQQLRKLILRIKTNSLEPGQPKDPDDSALFAIYRAFATRAQADEMLSQYRNGIGWGDAKQRLFELVNDELASARQEYERLVAAPDYVEDILCRGAERARGVSRPLMEQVRYAVGVRRLADLSGR